ncbi:hypothetical protein [Maribacter sp. 2307ULW6-5]|uniref:hypothetical protein n=1 Tax=Maribacter sp. 2307ULW6-5 TaxID=3386275 RepID=UPI0039BC7B98
MDFRKKCVVALLVFFAGAAVHSQNAQVEKSIYGLQTGVLGVWAHHERGLGNALALRVEVGLDAGLFGGSLFYDDGTGYLLIPSITLEPRWYYNLQKRAGRSRNTDHNGGNFLSLKTTYLPDWFVISNYDNINVVNQVMMIPTWGIKRNLGAHFNYELGLGIGYRYTFAKSAGFSENEGDVAANLHLRIGYRFP